ncbi:Hint domain-containing protein [Silicimonas sp. MF1-12-2]|uniref:Hint domain-containing protein n=1 Tax=Silicimonas sp. MF1-12-2 TaxID=3384793 RepID=UPI0039B64F27
MPFSVWARGDSSSANNSSLNTESTNQQPTTLLTFEATAGGDEKLEFNKGAGTADEDTVVYLNSDPTPYTFVLEFGGYLPQSNKLSNVNGEDLRGAEIYVLTIEATGERFFFLAGSDGSQFYFDIMDAFPNGAHAIQGLFACYTEGTLIETPDGPRPIEAIAPGDLVTTLDGRHVPVRFSAKRHVRARELRAFPALQPILIPAGSVAPGMPSSDLTVSALHRVLVRDPDIELLFGLDAAYVAARDLPRARPAPIRDLTYVHVLCDSHECLIANGCQSESLLPGDVALASLGQADAARVREIVGERPVHTAFPCLKGYEAALWRRVVLDREKLTA